MSQNKDPPVNNYRDKNLKTNVGPSLTANMNICCAAIIIKKCTSHCSSKTERRKNWKKAKMLCAHWNIGQKHGCIRLAVPLVKICSAESAKKKSSQTYIFLYVALTDKRPCWLLSLVFPERTWDTCIWFFCKNENKSEWLLTEIMSVLWQRKDGKGIVLSHQWSEVTALAINRPPQHGNKAYCI